MRHLSLLAVLAFLSSCSAKPAKAPEPEPELSEPALAAKVNQELALSCNGSTVILVGPDKSGKRELKMAFFNEKSNLLNKAKGKVLEEKSQATGALRASLRYEGTTEIKNEDLPRDQYSVQLEVVVSFHEYSGSLFIVSSRALLRKSGKVIGDFSHTGFHNSLNNLNWNFALSLEHETFGKPAHYSGLSKEEKARLPKGLHQLLVGCQFVNT